MMGGEESMAEYLVGRLDEIPVGAKRVVMVRGVEIGVFNIDGVFYALPNRCTHQWGPLCQGQLAGTVEARAESDWVPQFVRDGHIIVCPWHFLEFDVTTGQCLAHPRVKLRHYPVRVDGDVVKLIF
jgi:nitrite reductase/ring-hydroxylating ferredoxin subunit